LAQDSELSYKTLETLRDKDYLKQNFKPSTIELINDMYKKEQKKIKRLIK